MDDHDRQWSASVFEIPDVQLKRVRTGHGLPVWEVKVPSQDHPCRGETHRVLATWYLYSTLVV